MSQLQIKDQIFEYTPDKGQNDITRTLCELLNSSYFSSHLIQRCFWLHVEKIFINQMVMVISDISFRKHRAFIDQAASASSH